MDDHELSIRRELINALIQSPLLQFVGHNYAYSPELREMLETAEIAHFNKGDIIIREGQQGTRLYVLASGRVSIRKKGMAICTLSRLGDVFGEIGAIMGESRTATVVAESEVTCLATDNDLVERLTREGKLLFVHLLQLALTKILMGRLRLTTEELAQVQDDFEFARRETESLKRANAQLKEENARLTERLQDAGLGRFHNPLNDD